MIFYKKKYQGVIWDLKEANKRIEYLKRLNTEGSKNERQYKIENEKLKREIEYCKETEGLANIKYKDLQKQNEVLEEKYKKSYIESRNKTRKIHQLEKEIEDLKSDRYLVKKLPKTKEKPQEIGIKRGIANYQTKKILKEKSELNDIPKQG